MAVQGNDSRNLLELAVDVHTDLGKLVTGLAHAGANPQAVQSLQRMVEIVGEIAKLLGSGPVGAQGQPGAGPEAGEPGPGGPPEAAPASAAAPAPAAAQPPSASLAHPAFHQASAELSAALASKHAAAQKALAGGQ